MTLEDAALIVNRYEPFGWPCGTTEADAAVPLGYLRVAVAAETQNR